MSFLNHLINGMGLGSVYAIIALGYTMVYGIAKMLNFAHGDIIMVGAYVCFFATSTYGLPPLVGVLLAMLVCTVLGVVIERLASLAVLITAIGMSYFLQNAAQLLWTPNPKIFPQFFATTNPDGTQQTAIPLFDGALNLKYTTIVNVAACVIIMLALTWFTGKTKMGKAMRACSENKAAAQLMGIDVNATISLTFAIGSFLGGILLGVIEILAGAYISTQLANAIVFAVLIVTLLVRPAGLLGKPVAEKV